MQAFIIAAIALLIFAAAMIVDGWALSIVWNWFIVDIFSAPALSIAEAIGISLVFGILTNHLQTSSDDTDDALVKGGRLLAKLFLTPVLFVLIAWVVYQLV